MLAFAIDRSGETGALRELAAPAPGANDILVRIRAAGVNPVDWKIRDEISRHQQRTFPLVLGQDFAGVVDRPGHAVTGLSTGERIFGIARTHGAYAEYTVVPANDPAQPVAPTPSHLSDAQAAALPTAGLTALAAIEALDVRSGRTVLVIGASGGVGGYAVQIALARRAHIIAVASSRNHAVVESLGAQEVIEYDRADIAASVKAAHPEGIDAVLDLASDPAGIKRIVDVLRTGGRIVSTIRAVDEAWVAARAIRGVNLGLSRTPQSSTKGLEDLADLVASGAISIRLQAEMPLSQAGVALELSRSGQIRGKVVLVV